MRKKILIVISILIPCLLISCKFTPSDNRNTTNPTLTTTNISIKDESITILPFSIDEYYYREYIKNFSSDKNIGDAQNPKTVIQKAKEIWIDIYGTNSLNIYESYQIYYDEKNDIWFVTGTLPPDTVGGGPCILISKTTGDVLAIWQEK